MTYINKDYWNEFYKSQQNLLDPSTFSKFIFEYLEQDAEQYLLVDLGCGTGKDSFYFSSRGVETIGVDGSQEVVKKNNSLKEKDFFNNNLQFICQDLSDNTQVGDFIAHVNALAKQHNKRIIFYTRFFLHAIPESVEDILLENIKKNCNVDYQIVAEFRTKEDESIQKIFDNHYRRYIETDKFLIKLMNGEFSLKYFFKARGLSIFKGENPYLARVIFTYSKES